MDRGEVPGWLSIYPANSHHVASFDNVDWFVLSTADDDDTLISNCHD